MVVIIKFLEVLNCLSAIKLCFSKNESISLVTSSGFLNSKFGILEPLNGSEKFGIIGDLIIDIKIYVNALALLGLFIVTRDSYQQLAKQVKYSGALFRFAYPKHITEIKILAKRGKNFVEVVC